MHPCQRCGACCAHYRVSFYWGEPVPAELTAAIGPHRAAMLGTLTAPVRCVALEGRVGDAVACAIYDRRASPCREVQPGDGQCNKARLGHGLAALAPDRLATA